MRLAMSRTPLDLHVTKSLRHDRLRRPRISLIRLRTGEFQILRIKVTLWDVCSQLLDMEVQRIPMHHLFWVNTPCRFQHPNKFISPRDSRCRPLSVQLGLSRYSNPGTHRMAMRWEHHK